MTGYEILPLDLDEELLEIDEVIRLAQAMNNPIVNRIIAKYKASSDCWNIFYKLHKKRKSVDFEGMLGVAKLGRAHSDAYAELLREIVEADRGRWERGKSVSEQADGGPAPLNERNG